MAELGEIKSITIPNQNGVYLLKDATARAAMLPSGGTAGQFLVKQSSTNYDAAWITVPNANGVSF